MQRTIRGLENGKSWVIDKKDYPLIYIEGVVLSRDGNRAIPGGFQQNVLIYMS
jgi:hypothetical protein